VAIQDPNEAAQGGDAQGGGRPLPERAPVVCQRDLPVGAAAIRVAHFSRSRRKMSDLPSSSWLTTARKISWRSMACSSAATLQILKAESGKRALEPPA